MGRRRPTRLRQILFNLLNNALKFTSRGQVSLQAHRIVQLDKNKVQIQITISDTGIGLSQEQIAHYLPLFIKPMRLLPVNMVELV